MSCAFLIGLSESNIRTYVRSCQRFFEKYSEKFYLVCKKIVREVLSVNLYENHYKDLQKVYTDVKCSHHKLSEELSKVDKLISELYHELEETDITVNLGYQYSIALQNLLRKRRVIKEEFRLLSIINSHVDMQMKKIRAGLSRGIKKNREIKTSLRVLMTVEQ